MATSILHIIVEVAKQTKLTFDEVWETLSNYGITDEYGNLTDEVIQTIGQ